jgi:Flp pilus assembly pilin Flp
MVEYAILVAHNSASVISGMGANVRSWISGLDWTLLGYAVGGLCLLWLVVSAVKPTRPY